MPKKIKKSKSATVKSTTKAENKTTKGHTLVELLRRKQGATLNELTAATSWQNHSVRGFLSAQVSKKMGMKVESTKREDGQRVYRITS